MIITLEHTYIDGTTRKQELEREIAKLEEKLQTPERTVDDIVLHIRLLKEYRQCK